MKSLDSFVERRSPRCALVADADAAQRQRIETAARERGVAVVSVATEAEVRANLSASVAILIVSTKLPDLWSLPLLLRAARRASPLIECAVIRDAGELGPLPEGVRLLTRPVQPEVLAACIDAAEETHKAVRWITTVLVGRVGLKEAQRMLRGELSRAALARCSGSRRAAAALLGVDRRYVQKLCADKPGKDLDRPSRTNAGAGDH